MTSTNPDAQRAPVDRKRRFRFVVGVVAFSLGMSALLVVASGLGMLAPITPPLIPGFINAAMGLATATTLAYITGSVVDYNGGVANLFTGKNGGGQ